MQVRPVGDDSFPDLSISTRHRGPRIVIDDNEENIVVYIRKNCFTTNYFKGCLDALLITDEKDIQRVMKDISIIHQVPI